ncbi:unnamed protein product [Cladocopium goreaui]|uniref:Uncharacterized protein n=1 Tax=Cladocopium goreaui TaxID=2562237 RepID=A0A9P1BNG1_9DINO|nr:unnamed protein product [Cladocopium goreaui]|mmetsp:Transcript_2886/g.6569  ORF Transcript_2886/g.6569 Transcript_2886/m.6569 type:complete len:211 (+) Transcript_2886:88-720(+)
MTNLNNRSGLGNAGVASVAFCVAIATGVAALAATGASAAAGIAVLAATGAAVVGARSSDADEPCWASHCGRQDQLSSELVAVLPAQRVELDVSSPLTIDSVKVRKVHFNLTKNTVHEITPYSEVYGMHPRLLGIQKGSSTLEPLKDSDEDDESSELADGILGQWALAKVSKFWPLLGLTAFWFCVLGPATFLEITSCSLPTGWEGLAYLM